MASAEPILAAAADLILPILWLKLWLLLLLLS
jgi:hypothetical protein